MKNLFYLPVLCVVLSPSALAQITWTGAMGSDIFEEANWDLSNSTVTSLDPNVSIDDDVLIQAASGTVLLPELPGQGRFQLADGRTLTLDASNTLAVGNDGFGGQAGNAATILIDVINGSSFQTFFVVNNVHVDVDGTSRLTFGGGGNPVNITTVNMTAGSVVSFKEEDVVEFTNEHLVKFSVDGVPAVIGGNIDVVSDGAAGCQITVLGTGTTFCDPADVNSTGSFTKLVGAMSAPGGSGLHLEVSQGPPNQFAYFLIGTNSSEPGLTISQGHLCLSVAAPDVFGRYNVVGGGLNSVGLFDSGGVLQNAVGTSSVGSGFDVPLNVPIPGVSTIQSGETWHFQLWHRENGGASNFSNGLSITF